MNEENPSTDATFDRLLDELHGIQSGQSYAAALEWTSRLRAGLGPHWNHWPYATPS